MAVNLQDFLQFLDNSPTAWHAAENAAARLRSNGYQQISGNLHDVSEHNQFFYVENGALVAISLPEKPSYKLSGFHIIGAHSDSPGLRIKTENQINKDNYRQLAVEVYGSPRLSTWFDRDLSIAGRVFTRDATGIKSNLVDLKDPVGIIPTLAVHLEKEGSDKGTELNRQDHLPVILSLGTASPDVKNNNKSQSVLLEMLSDHLMLKPEDIISYDLFFKDTQPAALTGLEKSILASGRLDNLVMSYLAVQALIQNKNETDMGNVAAIFNHEETGSKTAAGAASSLLENILEQTILSHKGSRLDYLQAIKNSFLISADMAHAIHPNYSDRHDANQKPVMGGGPVIKINANQSYMTDAYSEAIIKSLAQAAEVPVQYFHNRNDLRCGSTIGPHLSTRLGIPAADIGNAMLAMHSIREYASVADLEYAFNLFSRFYSCTSIN